LFGMKKKAMEMNAQLVRANSASRGYTSEPNGQEFFARYFNDVGYVLCSWDRGVVVVAKSASDLVSALREVATSVEAHGAAWRLGPVGSRNPGPPGMPDFRKTL